MTPETLWALFGGSRWNSPLNTTTFRLLVRRAHRYTFDAVVAIALANYRTHWQLALDGNLPVESREEHKTKAINFGCALGNRLNCLTRATPVTPPVVF